MQTQKIDIGEPEFEDINDRGPVAAVLIWKDKHYKLFNGDNIVGRGKQCDVCIDHNTVSDTHCEVLISNGSAHVKDLRSSNGTFVEITPPGSRNFNQIRKGQVESLSSGCAIRFGIIHCVFKFQNIMDEETQAMGDDYDIPDSPDASPSINLDLPLVGGDASMYDAPTQCMPDSDEEKCAVPDPASRLSVIPEYNEAVANPLPTSARTIVDSPTQIVDSDDDSHVPVGHQHRAVAFRSSGRAAVTEVDEYDVEDDGEEACERDGHSSCALGGGEVNPASAAEHAAHTDTDTDATEVSSDGDRTPPTSHTLSASVPAGVASTQVPNRVNVDSDISVAPFTATEGNVEVNTSVTSTHTLLDDNDSYSDQSQDLMLHPTREMDLDVLQMILPGALVGAAECLEDTAKQAVSGAVELPPAEDGDEHDTYAQVLSPSLSLAKVTPTESTAGARAAVDDEEREESTAPQSLNSSANDKSPPAGTGTTADILVSAPDSDTFAVSSAGSSAFTSAASPGVPTETSSKPCEAVTADSGGCVSRKRTSRQAQCSVVVVEPALGSAEAPASKRARSAGRPQGDVSLANESVPGSAQILKQSTHRESIAVTDKGPGVISATMEADSGGEKSGDDFPMERSSEVPTVAISSRSRRGRSAVVEEGGQQTTETKDSVVKGNVKYKGDQLTPGGCIGSPSDAEVAEAMLSGKKKRGRRGDTAVVLDTAQNEDNPIDSSPAPIRKAARRGRVGTEPLDTALLEAESTPSVASTSISQTTTSAVGRGKGTGRSHARGRSGCTATPASTLSATAAAAGDGVESALQEGTSLRILFTGIDRDGDMEKAAEAMGAVVVSDLRNTEAPPTHCVTASTLKRTPKLLMAINRGVKYIVTTQWLNDSIKAGSAIPISLAGGRGSNVKYLVKDTAKEKLWQFNLQSTLNMSRGSGTAAGSGSLFEGLSFFVTKGVCGYGAPPVDEMKEVIESGSGKWLTSLSSVTGGSVAASKKKKGSSAAVGSAPCGTEGLVVISSETVASKEVTKTVRNAAAAGAGKGIYSIEFVFLAILRQHVDFDSGILEGFVFK